MRAPLDLRILFFNDTNMRLLITLLLAASLAALAFSQEGAKSAPTAQKSPESAQEWAGEPYTLETCAASGRPIDVKGTPQTVRFAGRELKFCCKGCADYVKKDPGKFLGKVDEKLIAQQKPIYPSGKCLVAGKSLTKGGKDAGVDVMVGNRLFRVCCRRCVAKVKADPAKYAAQLDAMVLEQAEKDYAMESCVVNPKRKLDAKSKTAVIAGRAVKTCCSGCMRKVRSKPMSYIPAIDAAMAEARKEAAAEKAAEKSTGKG